MIQYKFLFIFIWIFFYIIFPTWALPISVNERGGVFIGLIVFFYISAIIMNRWFRALTVDVPPIIPPKDLARDIKNNRALFIVCCLALILHIYPLSLPILIIGDEALHLQSGLWLYEHIGGNWHKVFQITFWILIVMLLFFRKIKKIYNFHLITPDYIQKIRNNSLPRFLFIIILLLISVSYFLLIRNFTYYPGFIHYPHLVKLLYYIVYSAFGITPVGPRMIQLIFYILSAVYLYRTILLFSRKEAALTGATILLFLPVPFVYARLAEISCGTIFFVTLISFHLLRFIKQQDNRDILLTSFFIGMGFMYRQEIFLMFFVCTAFMIARGLLNRDPNLITHLTIMSLSLVTIMPWMIISKLFSWRNYKIIWSNFKPFDGKVFSFFLHMPADMSWIIFTLFLFSVVFILIFKRNTLSLFFGLVFIAYYFFLALDIANYSPRLAMTYYPAIAVYSSLFVGSIIEKISWKRSFRIIYLALFVYLISICTVPSLNAQFLSSVEFRKLRYFPSDDAMKWVNENVKRGEKILTLRIMSSDFYRIKYGIDKNRIISFWYEINEVSTPEKLKLFITDNKVSYIMIPYNAVYVKKMSPDLDIFEYLVKNQDKEFMKIAKYNIDENYIYIFKVKQPVEENL